MKTFNLAARIGGCVAVVMFGLAGLFPPLECPGDLYRKGQPTFAGARTFLLAELPPTYWVEANNNSSIGDPARIETGRLLAELAFFAAVGLLCKQLEVWTSVRKSDHA